MMYRVAVAVRIARYGVVAVLVLGVALSAKLLA
jgi:hypothetical protein